MQSPLQRWMIVWWLFPAMFGCSSRPARIEPPKINAQSASAAALKAFDTDADGTISGAELDLTPGIKGALGRIDKDGDNKVTAAELAARIEELTGSRAGALPATCMITMSGRPLTEATVTFEPEPFLADAVSVATGTTDPSGMASLQSQAVAGGAQVGLYRIRISKKQGDRETIPSKYNEKTTLGAEISRESPAVTTTMGLEIKLTP